MTDKYQRLRDALAAGPTPGLWHTGDASHALDVYDEAGWPVASIPFSFAPRKAGENVCNANYIAAASPDTIAALLAEHDRLVACLKDANSQAEHFEREWYLRGDEIEKLSAERNALREALTVARDYVADELGWLREAYKGYETAGQVPETERDLASIDAVLAMGEDNE